jgi:hypothetical protein
MSELELRRNNAIDIILLIQGLLGAERDDPNVFKNDVISLSRPGQAGGEWHVNIFVDGMWMRAFNAIQRDTCDEGGFYAISYVACHRPGQWEQYLKKISEQATAVRIELAQRDEQIRWRPINDEEAFKDLL